MLPVRRVATLLLPALAGAAVASATLGPAAPAAASNACVGVVIDGRLAGEGVRTACATGDPTDGLAALTKAGVRYAFVPRVPGQLCQLDGVPACSDTGADTYWSYWWRAKGSSRWVYATTGAGSHDPEPGDTEAWVWQDGGRREPPDIAFARICPQAGGSAGGPRSSSPARSGPGAASGAAVPLPDPTSTAKPTATPTRPAGSTPPPSAVTSPSPDATDAASTSQSAPPAEPTAADEPGGAPPWAGLGVGALLVLLLAGAAIARARRSPR